MNLSFTPLQLSTEREILLAFLSGNPWPFHVNSAITEEKAAAMISDGLFTGTNHESFWVRGDSENPLGLIRLIDLEDIDDGYPLFDLRISSRARGKGVGKAAVQWLTNYLFKKHPHLERIAGTTRADNKAMRKTFRACGYVKEGHYRKDWPTSSGALQDTVKYSILREDWLSGGATPVNWNDEP